MKSNGRPRSTRISLQAMAFRVWLSFGVLAPFAFVGTVRAEERAEPKLLLTWGQRGDKPGEFHSPISIAITSNDEVFVTDLNNARIQQFTNDGEYRGGFDLPLDAPPRKSCLIGGMAIDDTGLIYLGFMNQHRIAVYTPAGEVIREWGKRGTGDGEFHMPGGIVLLPDKTLLAVDQCNHRVQKFTTDGKYLGQWGGYGSEPGRFGAPEAAGSRFGGPHFLAKDSKDRLYTTEGVAGRIQQLSLDGRPLRAWGNKSSEPGGFGEYQFGNMKNSFGPVGVLVDRSDRIWVSSLNDRVQAFSPEGKFLFGIDGTGDEPGKLSKPHGMAVDNRGHLYVADAGNQRIQKFELPP